MRSHVLSCGCQLQTACHMKKRLHSAKPSMRDEHATTDCTQATAHLGDVDGQERGHRGGEQLVQRRVYDELVTELEQERGVPLADAAHLREAAGA